MAIRLAGDMLKHLLTKQERSGGMTRAALRNVMTRFRTSLVMQGHQEYGNPSVEDATPIPAYINQGRWLVDCTATFNGQVCRNAVQLADRAEDAEAPCLICGTIWTNVQFPKDVDEIEDALSKRPRRDRQNWKPGETLKKIRDENDEKVRP